MPVWPKTPTFPAGASTRNSGTRADPCSANITVVATTSAPTHTRHPLTPDVRVYIGSCILVTPPSTPHWRETS